MGWFSRLFAKPVNIEAELAHAKAAYARGNLATAQWHYIGVLSKQQHNAAAHIGLAWTTLRLGLPGAPQLAVQAARSAVRAAPGDALAHTVLGISLGAAGSMAEALEAFTRVLALEPGNVEAMVNSANCLQALARLDEAVAMLRRALALEPASALANLNLGLVQLDANEAGAAVATLEAALGHHQPHPLVRFHLARAERANGQVERSRAQFTEFIAQAGASAQLASFVEASRMALAELVGK